MIAPAFSRAAPSNTMKRHGASLPWSGTREAIVSIVSISAALGAGPVISIGFTDRRIFRSSRASGIAYPRYCDVGGASTGAQSRQIPVQPAESSAARGNRSISVASYYLAVKLVDEAQCLQVSSERNKNDRRCRSGRRLGAGTTARRASGSHRGHRAYGHDRSASHISRAPIVSGDSGRRAGHIEDVVLHIGSVERLSVFRQSIYRSDQQGG